MALPSLCFRPNQRSNILAGAGTEVSHFHRFLRMKNAKGVMANSPGLPVLGLPWEWIGGSGNPKGGLWRTRRK
jgi:hypothetical protein